MDVWIEVTGEMLPNQIDYFIDKDYLIEKI